MGTAVYQHDGYGKQNNDFASQVKEAIAKYGNNRAKVDDGYGGYGWLFFDSPEALATWKRQK